MISTIGHWRVRALVLGCLIACLPGCYYMQAARGQLEVMSKREPIDDLIAADGTPDELAERLEIVTAAREFSIDELRLPDNDSYRSYADLKRDYVVWNVVAAPEFSLEPRQWCFPVAGCVTYRGYFSEDAARRKAARLAERGDDVVVGGVAAYSTLGTFSDPVLNTMMRWDDVDLVAVLFHELAHQKLYVKGDTGFNESFASAVEEIGMERWLSSRGAADELVAYRERRDLRQRFSQLVEAARADLQAIYARDIAVEHMREEKRRRLAQLAADLDRAIAKSGRSRPDWLGDGLNNARLAAMAPYHERVPQFHALLAECDGDLECFYAAAARLAERD